MTPLRKIQDLAQRIDRLGRYVAKNPSGPKVTKAKGVMVLSFGDDMPGIRWMIVCVPREGRVWTRLPDAQITDGPDLDHAEGIKYLVKFEAEILAKAQAQAREEVVAELVTRKLRRVTRAKSRGFKATQKKKAA